MPLLDSLRYRPIPFWLLIFSILVEKIIKKCIFITATPRPIEVYHPCSPSPCGINAECSERSGAASCSCRLDYIGNPYVECKPECVVNAECARNLACVSQHCVDPCPGVCGAHASCTVLNHAPTCNCEPGYTGNAFIACQRVTSKCMYVLMVGWLCLWNDWLIWNWIASSHTFIHSKSMEYRVTMK